MSHDNLYLISYDIEDDRERNRVSKLLTGYGFRVQKSVFECRLSKSGKGKLISKLQALELETGFALIYRLRDGAKRSAIGLVPANIKESEEHSFIV